MTKSRLEDLNDHLFAQLERLGEENISPEKLQDEIARAGSIMNIGKTIIENGRLVLDATKAAADLSVSTPPKMPKMLTGKPDA